MFSLLTHVIHLNNLSFLCFLVSSLNVLALLLMQEIIQAVKRTLLQERLKKTEKLSKVTNNRYYKDNTLAMQVIKLNKILTSKALEDITNL
jgi:type IV secretory pathway VirB3-like protein